MDKPGLNFLWVQDDSPIVIERFQNSLQTELSELNLHFYSVETIDNAFNYYANSTDQINIIWTDIAIPFGNIQKSVINMLENQYLWASTNFNEQNGGIILLKLIVELERLRKNNKNFRLTIPVVYVSKWYQEGEFIEYLRLWHKPKTYYWYDLLRCNYPDLAQQIRKISTTVCTPA